MTDDLTRRQAVAAALGAVAAAPAAADDAPKTPPVPKPAPGSNAEADRKRVLAVGMTEAEADCWALIARAAGKFFDLPKLHPMDDQEVAQAVHVIQNKLLARPTYRKYLELAKAGEKK